MDKVCAVIVTYNRKELLRKCLKEVFSQTRRPDHILVVDNASTDGTYEMIKEEYPEAEILKLEQNRGGAGGFYEGVKLAYESGYKWLWLMDDDGYPLNNTLEMLLSIPNRDVVFRGCVVVDKEDPSKLAFDYPGNDSRPIRSLKELMHIYENEGIIPGFVNPFNGVLISEEVIRKIGMPKADFFMWGDEAEYMWRAKRNDILIATVVHAKFVHPKDRMKRKRIKILGREITLSYAEEPDRFAMLVRNQAYIYTRYISITKWLILTLLYVTIFRRHSWLLAIASIQGALGRVGI